MFYYLNGTITHINQNLAVIDVGGVGFACHTSLVTLAKLKRGEKATLFTYLHVREELMDLYGFADEEELSYFKMLINISGVGPKAALSILSSVSPSQLALSVVTGDEKPLLAASGVGKKLAQRVILELKDKIAKDMVDIKTADGMQGVTASDAAGEAYAALAVLGYSQSEISPVLKSIDSAGLTAEEIIKKALKGLMRQ